MQSSKHFKLTKLEPGRKNHSPKPSPVRKKASSNSPEAKLIRQFIGYKSPINYKHAFKDRNKVLDRILNKGNKSKLSKSSKEPTPMRILNKTERNRDILKIYLDNKHMRNDSSIAQLNKKNKPIKKFRLPNINIKDFYANLSPIRLTNKSNCASKKKLLANESSYIDFDKSKSNLVDGTRNQKQEIIDPFSKPLGNYKRIYLESVTPTPEFSEPIKME